MKIRVNEIAATLNFEAENAAENYQLRALYAQLQAVGVHADIVDRALPSISIRVGERKEVKG